MLHKHGYYVQVKITVMLLQRDIDGNLFIRFVSENQATFRI